MNGFCGAFFPDKLTLDSLAPLLAGADGKYPVPQLAVKTRRDF